MCFLIRAALAPLHRRPSRHSEQVSQLLLGDPVEVLESRAGWRRVRGTDSYAGWVGSRVLCPPPAGWGPPFLMAAPLVANLRFHSDSEAAVRIPAFAGVRLPLAERRKDWLGLRLPDGATGWVEPHRFFQWNGPAASWPTPAAVARTAERFLGVPYLWGGSSALGLDCSGLVQLVWRLHGWQLPRDARDQARLGDPVPLEAAATGDLLFFGGLGSGHHGVTHVGVCVCARRMIHAPGGDAVQLQARSDPPYAETALLARRLTRPPEQQWNTECS